MATTCIDAFCSAPSAGVRSAGRAGTSPLLSPAIPLLLRMGPAEKAVGSTQRGQEGRFVGFVLRGETTSLVLPFPACRYRCVSALLSGFLHLPATFSSAWCSSLGELSLHLSDLLSLLFLTPQREQDVLRGRCCKLVSVLLSTSS